ncbi:MAG: diguanylate cyclase [Acidobacteriota bacterium]
MVLLLCILAGILSQRFSEANSRVVRTTQVMTELRAARIALRSTARAHEPAEANRNAALLMQHVDRVRQLFRGDDPKQESADELALRAAAVVAAQPAERPAAAELAEAELDSLQDTEYGLLAQYNRAQANTLLAASVATAGLFLVLLGVGIFMGIGARSGTGEQQNLESLLGQERRHSMGVAHELSLISAGSELVQSTRDEERLVAIVTDVMNDVLPGSSGHLSLLRPLGDVLDVWSSWGALERVPPIPQKECTALQLGRNIHRSQATHQFECLHEPPGLGDYLCLPLRSAGRPLGILHVESPVLVSKETSDAVGLFAAQVAVALENLHMSEAMQAQTVRDPLTGLFNRRYFDEELEREIQNYRHEGIPYSLLMMDIDHFKHYNDTYGHEAGDEALRGLARTLRSVFHENDVVCRYGGEEFATLMRRTGLEGSYAKAESFRLLLESAELSGIKFGFITVSIGVASGAEFATPRELLHASDAALYEAKRLGRNRTCVCTDHADMLPTVAQHIPPPPPIGASVYDDPLSPY